MDPLADFSVPVRTWYKRTFSGPTRAQALGFGPIHAGTSTLLLAPTGSGKTLAAFLSSLDRLMTEPPTNGVRVLYVSPLKALAVDVEKNLRVPVEGIRTIAAELGTPIRVPQIAMRTGDTLASDRARFLRRGAEILITTPESLYLLLTSQASRHLTGLQTVIVDEIHSLLPTKRGAHLFLSLERLEQQRTCPKPLQRIGLSATQHPIDEAARLLAGGFAAKAGGEVLPRPVEIVDARMLPRATVSVRASSRGPIPQVCAAAVQSPPQTTRAQSAWPDIEAQLLALINEHRSTLVFVNSRRQSERLAMALNELAGHEVALAHHGSVAKARRSFIEEQLKLGALKALVATSSLELGIDMGAIDLVAQVAAPPSVASGLQRIGRSGHHVGATSSGVLFPKHPSELLSVAAVVQGMKTGQVEATSYPRNPLDVLAQQIVATLSMAPSSVEALYEMTRRAAHFAQLPRTTFEGVLDMLSGRYPSDEFAELRPRITWDRERNRLSARSFAKRVAVTSGGTIADRGLYGVFLSNSKKPTRVGELDEEMVFESRVGDIFLLGASSWHIDEITFDRVLVSPAPGQPGKMPFWKGMGPGRPIELGRKIGELTRALLSERDTLAHQRLTEGCAFDESASIALRDYLREQQEATEVVPSDRCIVVERFKDELGDYRICILCPFGERVHAPWALALTERFRTQYAVKIDAVWSDDGIALRLPESEAQIAVEMFLFEPAEIRNWVVQGLSGSSLFAAHFRENAARALLLPKRDPRRRQPLWAQRRRSADLLRIASQYPSFPILIETYRECLQDVFDLPSLVELCRAIQSRDVDMVVVDTLQPSPFARAILFSYVGNFLYEGDAPLEERRAQALLLDQTELRSLLGEAELRELLDAAIIETTERELQYLHKAALRHPDDVHDLLLRLGDLSEDELVLRAQEPQAIPTFLAELVSNRRIAQATIARKLRYFALEDAGKLRDALGIDLPANVPSAFLESTPNALAELVSRFARTHGPFTANAPAVRFGIAQSLVESALKTLERLGRVQTGDFLPNGHGLEWCDRNVLRQIKQRSLAQLRRSIAPVSQDALARHVLNWQGIQRPQSATLAMDRAIDQLQGLPLLASVLTESILPARIRGFFSGMLDTMLATGEVTFLGVESVGASDGRIALYRPEMLARLAPPATKAHGELAERIRTELSPGGALFFTDLVRRIGGFPPDLLKVLWDMVWASEVTNDSLLPLRSRRAEQRGSRGRPAPRGRRPLLPGSEGRWSLVVREALPTAAEARAARAQILLDRYGVVTREVVNADNLGSFSELYPVFLALEDAGKLRRGFFVEGLGGAQFARPGVPDSLRKAAESCAHAVVLAATDPANLYGGALPWPASDAKPQRAKGALVVLHRGRLIAYVSKGDKSLATFIAADEPERANQIEELVLALTALVCDTKRRALFIETIDGVPARLSPLAAALRARGFTETTLGLSFHAPLTGAKGMMVGNDDDDNETPTDD